MPVPDSCGGDLLANELLISLTAGKDFTLPDVDLTQPEFQLPATPIGGNVTQLTLEDLTTQSVDGTGVFDGLMKTVGAHLRNEFEKNRITGREYSETYIAALGGAMTTAVQFLLGKDQAYWGAMIAQQQARAAEIAVITARVGLETAKATLQAARYQALNAEADFGLTKMKIATEDASFCLIKVQTESAELDVATKTFTNEFLLPKQLLLISEQVEVQRAQTSDTRTDGAVVEGSVGKQKDLYDQQITSYQRDAEVKAAKLFTDAWITQKTIDEGLLPPSSFANASLDVILTNLKVNNNLN